MNLKDHVVNTLISMGACDPTTGTRLTAKDLQGLDLNNKTAIRAMFNTGMRAQVMADRANGGADLFRTELADDFAAAKNLMLQSTNIPDAVCNNLLNNVVANTDLAVDTMLNSVLVGLPEQKGMNSDLLNEAGNFWQDVVMDGYDPQSGLQPAQFKAQQRHNAILSEVTKCLSGDAAAAQRYLAQPVDENNPLIKYNAQIRESYQKAAADSSNPLTMADVMMGLSQEASKAQIKAMCENRGREQQDMKATDPKKLGNVLGSDGRKELEKNVDGKISAKVTTGAATSGTAKYTVPPKKWRSYAKLRDAVKNIVDLMYASMQTLGFLARQDAAENKKKAPMKEFNPVKKWEIRPYENMPDMYQGTDMSELNEFGKFACKTKTRMASDKISIVDNRRQLQDFLQANPNLTYTDVVGYARNPLAYANLDAATQKTLVDGAGIFRKMEYYQSRIQASDEVLQRAAVTMAANPQHANNGVLYSMFSNQILNLQVSNRLPNETDAMYQARLQNNQAMVQNAEIQDVIKDDKTRDTANMWAQNIDTFHKYNLQDPNQLNSQAGYEIASIMMGMEDDLKSGQKTAADIDQILQNDPLHPLSPLNNANVSDMIRNGQVQPETCAGISDVFADVAANPDYHTKGLTQAGKTFSKLHSRMVADKVFAVSNGIEFKNILQNSQYGLKAEDVAEYITNPSTFDSYEDGAKQELKDAAAMYKHQRYFAQRVNCAQQALTDLQANTIADPNLIHDAAAMRAIDEDVLTLKVRPYLNESQENFAKRAAASQELVGDPDITWMIDDDRKASAATSWINALNTFKNYNASQNPLFHDASYRMIGDLFGISDRIANGEITVDDLDTLLINDAKRPFNPTAIDDMVKKLQSRQMDSEGARKTLHQAADTFMKDKYQESYAQYQLAAAAAQEKSNM